ncbi:MAG TPA: SusC/RagA family TonB-linked outer membrane protein, partial [Pedobacter sp.]|nr:SusC/RagA family TonB-linked outer membrane protein [Pedobacter sp.]
MYKVLPQKLWLPPCAIAKLLLIMKLTTLILITAILQVSATGFAQKISLREKNTPLVKVLEQIRSQSGYDFMFSNSTMQGARKVTINVRNQELKDVLKMIFEDQPLEYEINANTVILSKKEASLLENIIARFQAIDVRGRVVDSETDQPLVGATVSVKGKNRGITTGTNGEFFIQDVEERAILQISFIGYKTKEVKAYNEMGDLKLEIGSAELEEIKINGGYYTTTERARTGNISKVTARDIEKQPVTSLLMALQGRMTGVDIRPSNGEAGQGVTIRIRGQNSLRPLGGFPLYVIDGVPILSEPIPSTGNVGVPVFGSYGGLDPLSTIDPANVESIEVLKDADATSIYGSRGANGVVLITTKNGSVVGSDIDVGIYRGFGEMTNRLDVLNTAEYLQMRKEAFKNSGITPGYFHVDINGEWDTTRNVNWQEELLGKTADITNVTLGTSGGGANTSYNIGTGYHKESTLYPGDFGFSRLNGHFGIVHKSDNGKLNINLSGDYGVTKSKTFDDSNYINNALSLSPNAPPPLTANGELNWPVSYPLGESIPLYFFNNPMAVLRKTNANTINSLISNLSVGYRILQGLNLKTSFGFTDSRSEGISKFPIAAIPPGELYSSSTGRSYIVNNKRQSWIVESQATYERDFGNHHLGVMLGATLQDARNNGQNIEAYGFTSDAFLDNITGAADKFYTFIEGQYRYGSGFGRLSYDWNNELYLNITGRRDGSSRFGPDNRFGSFVSFGSAWIFTENSMLKDRLGFLSLGKLRGSFGTTGNDQIGDYRYLKSYGLTSKPYFE